MSKNSIRIGSKTEYVIEVNDAGETIFFDLTDTSLPNRLFRTFEEIDRLKAEYDSKIDEIANRPDTAAHYYESAGGEEKALTVNQRDTAVLIDKFYNDARAALDIFLGAGACQKIFGNKNFFSMFDDLMVQLKPHFQKMGLDTAGIQKTIATKYAPNRAARRALK